MAPIDLDNLEAAEKLSEIFELRSVPISYLIMLTIDNEHVFMFRTPPLEETDTKTLFHFDNVFYTNDSRYVERVTEMLNDMWKRGIDVKEIMKPKEEAKGVYVSSCDSAAKVIDRILENKVSSVIVVDDDNPVGIVSERDLLEKVVKSGRDPEGISAKEIMSVPVLTLDSNEILTKALLSMRKTGIRRLAVFKEGRLAGMLSLKPVSKTKDSK